MFQKHFLISKHFLFSQKKIFLNQLRMLVVLGNGSNVPKLKCFFISVVLKLLSYHIQDHIGWVKNRICYLLVKETHWVTKKEKNSKKENFFGNEKHFSAAAPQFCVYTNPCRVFLVCWKNSNLNLPHWIIPSESILPTNLLLHP